MKRAFFPTRKFGTNPLNQSVDCRDLHLSDSKVLIKIDYMLQMLSSVTCALYLAAAVETA